MEYGMVVVYIYSLLYAFIPQYSDRVDFISMGEAEMGTNGRPVPNWGPSPPCLPLEPPLYDRV